MYSHLMTPLTDFVKLHMLLLDYYHVKFNLFLSRPHIALEPKLKLTLRPTLWVF
jgi:hypothetical protein